MLVAANRHPALLRYLSPGPVRVRTRSTRTWPGRTSNCYSVGVDGGYTEKDVRQAALLQTGRSIRDDKYVYRADQHYVGAVEIMGFTHANATAAGGEAAAEEYFRYLALHPSTAKYIAHEPGHPPGVGHPASLPGRRGGRELPGQQGADQADADHAAELHPVLGLGRAEGAPADGVHRRHVPHPRRTARHSGRRSRTTTPTRARSCTGFARSGRSWSSSAISRPACRRRTAIRTCSWRGPRPAPWSTCGTRHCNVIEGRREHVHLRQPGTAARHRPRRRPPGRTWTL